MTVLTIVQAAAARVGIPVPSTVFASTDDQVIQLRALLNQSGMEMSSAADWVRLQTQHSFTTTATEVQADGLPDDFDHFMNNTMWDRTTDRPVYGPLNAVEWQREKAGPTFTSVYYAFRIRGTDFLLTPTPSAGDEIYYEYITTKWAETAAGVGITEFSTDTDVSRMPEELHTLDLIWRFKAAKGLDYNPEFLTFQRELDEHAGRSGGAPVLNMSLPMPYRRYQPNVPEGNWPGTYP